MQVRLPGISRAIRARVRDDSGGSLVETAVSLPILLMIVFAIAKVGIAYNNYIVLTDAVRAGARQLSMSRGTSNPCQTSLNRVYASAPTLTAGSLAVTLTVNGTAYAGSSPTCPGQGVLMTAGNDVIVRATYPCDLSIFNVNYATGCTLVSQSTVRIE